ncbi:MAG: response regulator transcription factor [Bacteroidales bacterium]|nr:response regulator transcription factor [Bacteroidales bacterium]
MKKIKIIIADDHGLFRDGIKSLLSSAENIEIVGEASSGNDLIDLLQEIMADVIFTDISMPGMSGIEATKIISEKYPDVNVIILSMHIDEEYIMSAIRAGAKGYLHKDTTREELLTAVSNVVNGEEYYNKDISEIVFKSYVNQTKLKSRNVNKKNHLTERELDIIKLIAEGYMNKEISDKLNISIRTVDTHKSNIFQKLKLKSSIDIVKYAIKNGIVKI